MVAWHKLSEMTSEGWASFLTRWQEVASRKRLKGKIRQLKLIAFPDYDGEYWRKWRCFDEGCCFGRHEGADWRNYETVGGITWYSCRHLTEHTRHSLIAANTAELFLWNGTYVAKIRILRAVVVAQRCAERCDWWFKPITYFLCHRRWQGLATAFVIAEGIKPPLTEKSAREDLTNKNFAENPRTRRTKERAKITELVKRSFKDWNTKPERDRQL